MTWGAVAIAGAAVVGAVVQSSSQKKANAAQKDAAQAGISEQQSARLSFEKRTQPFADIGLAAAPALADLLGIQVANPQIRGLETELADLQSTIDAGPQFVGQKGVKGVKDGFFGSTPLPFDLEGLNARKAALTTQIADLRTADTTAFEARGRQGLEEINPLVSFLRDEGFQDIQESAAARGRLGAGGTLQDLTRFNTNLTATVVPQLQQQRFNQLFNLLGLGSNAATGQGTAGLQTANNISNLLGQQGAAQAQGAISQSNIATNALGQLAGTFGAQRAGLFDPPQQQQQLNQGAAINPVNFGGFA